MKVFSNLLIIVFCLTTNIFSQVEFNPHTITTNADGARSVYAIDMDGDGDMDVLSASFGDNKIAWYENDGNENFTSHTITLNADGALSVYAVDVDGDGDIDVLSASQLDDKIAWYENDGNENFTPHTITTGADGAWSVYAVDVDGDGDIDVLSASAIDNKIAWYENDGNENFTSRPITTSADGATSVFAIDVDGDGDIDVLSSSLNDDKIAWYESDLVSSVTISNEIPSEFGLSQNYPNPFNPSTIIRFSISEESFVTLKVVNTLGEEITTLINENIIAGNYEVDFDATGLPSGIYFYKLQAGSPSAGSGQSFVETKKMVLMK